jgi:hypothetical protein
MKEVISLDLNGELTRQARPVRGWAGTVRADRSCDIPSTP